MNNRKGDVLGKPGFSYTMNKRGISELIATVLIIGITIAAFGLIYVYVIPMMKEGIASSSSCGNVKISINYASGYLCEDSAENLIMIPVLRGNDEVNLSGLQFRLVDSEGNGISITIKSGESYSFVDKSEIPISNTQKTYTVNLSALGISSLNEIGVAPIIKEGNKESVCDLRPAIANIERCSEKLEFIPMENPSAQEEILWTGLISYWKLDDSSGSIISDSAGENDKTINEAVYNPSGKFSGAYSFDGANDYAGISSGGTTTYFENYIIHTFTSSGTFNALNDLLTEVLVIGGGGGGGWDASGGGGSGGYLYNSSYPVASSNYEVIIGAGGIGGYGYSPKIAVDGGNSVFATITAYGGGHGAGYGAAATNGASGGGGNYNTESGSATHGSQGTAGGNGVAYAPYGGGGGGGSSATGTSASGSQSGKGGDGTLNSISGSPVYYAGGGGAGASYQGSAAGTGGLGGGGNGGASGTYGQNCSANTGGGGGGSSNSGTKQGGSGGSGIVIVRYLNNDDYTSSALWIKPASTGVWEFVAYNGSSYFKNGVAGNPDYYPLKGYIIGINAIDSSYFNGLIDEVAVWNRTLNSSEIEFLYNSGNGRTYSL